MLASYKIQQHSILFVGLFRLQLSRLNLLRRFLISFLTSSSIHFIFTEKPFLSGDIIIEILISERIVCLLLSLCHKHAFIVTVHFILMKVQFYLCLLVLSALQISLKWIVDVSATLFTNFLELNDLHQFFFIMLIFINVAHDWIFILEVLSLYNFLF